MSLLRRWHHRTLALLASVSLAACGGGIYLEFDDYDDLPPVVELAASSRSAFAGDSVRLVAAAADENGIDHVSFYRYDGNTAVRLGTDGSSPYEWQLLVPADGRSSVIVFAHAVDNAGNAADSNLVTISITP
jgi:Bacterial Ig domain